MINLSDFYESDIRVQYEFGGKFTSEESWIHPRRTIDTYEVIYVLDGEIKLEEENERYILTPGDVLILRPGCEHGGWQENSGKTAFYWIHFHADNFDGMKIRPGLLPGAGQYRFSVLFRQLLHIGNTPGYPPYAADAALALLLAELCSAQRNGETVGIPLVHEVAEWIRINSMHKLTAETVAEHFNYHSDYLCAIMRKHFGLRLKQYINRERIKLVKNLLLTTDLSIKQLAEKLEWESENQFIHYFQYHEKIGPACFRDLYYNTHLNNH